MKEAKKVGLQRRGGETGQESGTTEKGVCERGQEGGTTEEGGERGQEGGTTEEGW